MEYHKHYNLEGLHAFLSPSGYHWLNYTPEKMRERYLNEKKKQEGTELHDLASKLIKSRKRLAPLKQAFNQFVNDAIGLRMESELMLYYSDNCFGTADAIKYEPTNHHLQIHDLKTGMSKPSFKQLFIYAALFCLEYGINPEETTFETRLYQGMGYEVEEPPGDHIRSIMNKIIELDQIVTDTRDAYQGVFD